MREAAWLLVTVKRLVTAIRAVVAADRLRNARIRSGLLPVVCMATRFVMDSVEGRCNVSCTSIIASVPLGCRVLFAGAISRSAESGGLCGRLGSRWDARRSRLTRR